MTCENPNKKIIEDFIAAATRLLEQENESVASLLSSLNNSEECFYYNSDGIKYTYLKQRDEDDDDKYYILAKSDLMQEFHVLPDGVEEE